MEFGATEAEKLPLVISDRKFWKSVVPMQLNHVIKIQNHFSSTNCPLHPQLKYLIIDVHEVWGTTPLIIACQLGELKSVKYLVETWGVDLLDSVPYYLIPYQRQWKIQEATPLFVASFHGHYQIVHYLLEKGADVSAKTSNNVIPVI